MKHVTGLLACRKQKPVVMTLVVKMVIAWSARLHGWIARWRTVHAGGPSARYSRHKSSKAVAVIAGVAVLVSGMADDTCNSSLVLEVVRQNPEAVAVVVMLVAVMMVMVVMAELENAMADGACRRSCMQVVHAGGRDTKARKL